MSALVFNSEDIFTLIAPRIAHGYYQVFALKGLGAECFIKREPLKIGCMEFLPGEKYSRFGSNRKTSAGFIYYDGTPLEFCGTYKDHALFADSRGPFEFQEYPLCYWSWRFCVEEAIFLTVNHSNAGRLMHLDVPPEGPSKFELEESK